MAISANQLGLSADGSGGYLEFASGDSKKCREGAWTSASSDRHPNSSCPKILQRERDALKVTLDYSRTGCAPASPMRVTPAAYGRGRGGGPQRGWVG